MKMNRKTFASTITKYWYLLEFLEQSNFPVQNKEGREACNKAEKGNTGYNQITLYHNLPRTHITGIDPLEKNILAPHEALEIDMLKYKAYGVLSDEMNICFGKIERNIFAERLQQIFHQKQDLPEKNHKKVCLVGMKCDAKGRYIPGSINISPLAWGVNRLLDKKDDLTKENMAKFLSMEEYWRSVLPLGNCLEELQEEKIVGKLLTPALIESIIKMVEKEYLLGIMAPKQQINWEGVMIYRRYQNEESKAKDMDVFHDSDLSNSYFAKDLNMVIQAIESDKFGEKPVESELINYITGLYAEEKSDLGWMDFNRRVDVHNNLNAGGEDSCADFFHEHLDVMQAPLGKWPSKFMPCLMQQLAINLSWKPSPHNAPIFSVNGPPGTGKTTLLKEIVAGNIVERACLLAEYKNPDDAFVLKKFKDGDKKDHGYSKYCANYFGFNDDRLKDYGMLVASCNNAAVENITKELPDGVALLKGMSPNEKDDETARCRLLEVQDLFQTDKAEKETYSTWNQQSKCYDTQAYSDVYFTKLANDLVRRSNDNWDRWGLISAPFGKTGNLTAYIHAVLKPYIRSFGLNSKIQQRKEAYPNAVIRFRQQFDKVKKMEQELQEISGLRACFMKKSDLLEDEILRASVSYTQQEQSANKIIKKKEQLMQKVQQVKQVLRTYQTELTNMQTQKFQKEENLEDIKRQIQRIKQQILELEERRRFRDILYDLFHRSTMLSQTIVEQYGLLEQAEQAFQNQKENLSQLELALKKPVSDCNEQEQVVSKLENEMQTTLDEHEKCLAQVKRLCEKIQKCKQKIDEADRSYQAALKEASNRQNEQAMTVLNEEFFSWYNSMDVTDSTKAQMTNPWHTTAYNREREKLFFEALQLHKAFLLGSKACLWNFKNLLLIWSEPRGDDEKVKEFSQRDKEACFGTLLNTVFLLTPVLSTTFASAGKMLANIQKPGEIGCLIIDEAGQASPQMALGSLYRCRRAIVVGDPKQVEPVVTDELDLIKQVIQNDDTAYYQSKTHSVQGFADRLNNVGTTYSEGEQETWVGCPLVVHRRCISPMFDLSNALSYNNMMKQQTQPPSLGKEKTFCGENSGWINVSGSEKSTTGKNHYVEAQGEKAWKLILQAFQNTDEMPSLFVITPFTTVRDEFKKMVCSQHEYKKEERFQEWANQCIGTVHTFQGKEADQVIFLLGCDKNALPAVRWVNTNIVNVAVTRAKYRLYVVGDYTVWQQSELFKKVKGILDSYALCSLQCAMKDPESKQDKEEIGRLVKQIPGADSLAMDGELEDSLVAPLFHELDAMWSGSTLASEQLKSFHLTQADLNCLSSFIRKRLTSSILLYEMLTMMKKQYCLEGMDAACAGVLFCKTMEALLKEVLLEKIKSKFPDETINNRKLTDIKPEKADIGTFTRILNMNKCRSQLASCQATLFDEVCDEKWWKTYADDLDAFRLLRNACCHSEPLSWQCVEKLQHILFERGEFIKTLVGKAL